MVPLKCRAKWEKNTPLGSVGVDGSRTGEHASLTHLLPPVSQEATDPLRGAGSCVAEMV